MAINRQRNLGALSLVLLGLVFVAAVTANNSLLTGLRIDLTDENLYTVSPGTRNVLASIVEPINVYLFFSDSESADIAPLRNYANRVREMLEELEGAAGGNLVLHVIDPVPFSEEEDSATRFGLQPISLGIGQTLYFGLAATNSIGDQEVIEIFNPDRERFLEYELARLIYSLARRRQGGGGCARRGFHDRGIRPPDPARHRALGRVRPGRTAFRDALASPGVQRNR